MSGLVVMIVVSRNESFGFVERIETLRAANRIDVALCNDRAHPGGERAAPMKVVEQRAPLGSIGTVGNAVKLGPHRIGDLTRRRFIAADRACRRVKYRPVFPDEGFPRRRDTAAACNREREIFRAK